MSESIAVPTMKDPKAVALEYITPRSRRRIFRQPETELICQAERIPIGQGEISLRSWGEGKTVLLIHGWSANQSDLFAYVPAITARGFRAVTFDLPAHGESSGSTASLDQMAEGVMAVGAHLGAVHAVVAHSVGCAATSLAISQNFPTPERVAYLGPPESYEQFARQYGAARGLDESGVNAMIESLKNDGIRVALFSSEVVVDFKFPGLVVHSADDDVIPVAIGQRVAQAWPGCRFASVDHLGHRGILTDRAVIELVTDFIAE